MATTAIDESSWQLTEQQRADTVSRLAANLASLAFFRDRQPLGDGAALDAARDIERRAYTAAQVSARTTTGHRPRAETTSAYARKMGELVVEAVKSGAQAQHPAELHGPPSAAGGGDWWHDLSKGGRDFLDEEGARRALAPLLAADSTVGRVRLSTKSFGAAAAAVAASALRNVAAHLSHADLSDIIAGRPEDEALEALRVITESLGEARLRYLDLSDNALGEKGVRACAGALAGGPGEALEFLALRNVGCSVHACAAVEELVVGGQLRGLHLYNNMSGDEGAEHIAKVLARARHMQDFRMASSRVGARGGSALARALCVVGRPTLRRLDLSDNPLTGECAADLAACVAHHLPSLEALNLNDTSLTDEGVALVCRALIDGGGGAEGGGGFGRAAAATASSSSSSSSSSSPLALEELELALNEITPEGAASVAAALATGRMAKLRRVNLRENELEDEGALALARGGAFARLPRLEQLDLCGNQLGRSGAVAVARALAASKPSGFKALLLDENCISEAGVDVVKGVLKLAFGDEGVLGPLDDNDADADADGAADDEDDEAEEGGDDGGLSAAMAGVKV
jgi:Ran GTPase-activating protein (RanGAP) involved in mRNA processing and transport